jgi:hypothetical protein
MIARESAKGAWTRIALALPLLALGLGMSGCADMSESMTAAFADPAQYDLYNCKQLEEVRKTLANKTAELQGLIAKAQTGTGGTVVAEVAYRNDYIALRGQSHYAEEAWRKNRCRPSAPGAATASGTTASPSTPAPSANAVPQQPSRAGSAVY